MGMSASQVRLLTVTKRIHEVENEAQRIQNQKMLLGLESDEAYEEYLAAMEQKNIEYAFFDPNQGNFDWAQLNVNNLLSAGTGYHLKVKNLEGIQPVTVDVTSESAQKTITLTGVHAEQIGNTQNYKVLGTFEGQEITLIASQVGDTISSPISIGGEDFTYNNGTATLEDAPATKYTITLPNGETTTSTVSNQIGVVPKGTPSFSYGGKVFSGALIDGSNMLTAPSTDEFIECSKPEEVYAVLGTSAGAIEDPEQFLRELVYNAYGIIMSEQLDDDGVTKVFKETHIATNVGLRERDDDTRIAKAEAEYEAALRRIDKKEEKYDADLAKMDQERLALTTQLDTFKTCSKDNIERTFKIFS